MCITYVCAIARVCVRARNTRFCVRPAYRSLARHARVCMRLVACVSMSHRSNVVRKFGSNGRLIWEDWQYYFANTMLLNRILPVISFMIFYICNLYVCHMLHTHIYIIIFILYIFY